MPRSRVWPLGGLATWVEDDVIHISVVFTWQLAKADRFQKALKKFNLPVRVGGPAVDLLFGKPVNGTKALHHHNSEATFTSRGCIRKCPFCAVPIIEGQFRELTSWPVGRLICDNNLLAASGGHFDNVIDRLKPVKGVDFNQGLDARLLTPYHASRLAELDLHMVRLAFDSVKYETSFVDAFRVLTDAGVPKKKISVYVLMGFDDTPEEALYRLRLVKSLGAWPNPMRYQPLWSKKRNEYTHPNWTHKELIRFSRYWQNLRITNNIPFEEFRYPCTNLNA